ncbi:MAG TPA: hypothetical protein VFA26_20010 [Gemmataceae bacterium]|nr:hypothetical protein [Gemmataceae bacterium]
MSRHTPRSSRWARVSAKEHRSAFGAVRYHAGAWEGTVSYEVFRPGDPEPAWHAETAPAGRFKRPRNAMMAVEDRAREIRRQGMDGVRVAFEG